MNDFIAATYVRVLTLVSRAASWLLIALVRVYQHALGGVFGGHCRFEPTCSNYMIDAIRNCGAVRGLGLGMWRVLRCHPFSKGGFDPAPSAPCHEPIPTHPDAPGPSGREVRRAWTRADTLCVLGIVLAGALFSLTDMTRPLSASHDAKSALIVRQMVEKHFWFVTDLDVGWVNKPPLYYWLAAGVSALAGEVNEWTVRLPGLLACVAAAVFTWALARELWDRWTGLAAAVMLLTMAQFHVIAQSTRLDSMVALSVIAATFCYWKALSATGGAWKGGSLLWSSGGHLALAFGVAIKGPLAIVLTAPVIVAVLVVRRVTGEGRLRADLARLHPALGALIVFVLTAPIYLAMDRASGGRFLRYFFLRENLARAGIQVEDVKGFGGSYSVFHYFATIWYGAAPWSLFLPAGFVAAWRRRPTPRAAAILPVLLFALPFLLLSAVPYKKWAYLVSVMPPVAMLSAKVWLDAIRSGRAPGGPPLGRFLSGYFFVVAGVLVLLAAAVWFVIPRVIPDRAWSGAPQVAALSVVSALALMAALALFRRYFRLALVSLTAATIVMTLFWDFVGRPAESERVSQRAFAVRVDRWVAAQKPDHPPLYVCAGEAFELAFYLNVPADMVRDEDAGAFLARLRPVDASGSAAPAWVILSRECLNKACAQGSVDVIFETGPDESRDAPLTLAAVRIVDPAP